MAFNISKNRETTNQEWREFVFITSLKPQGILRIVIVFVFAFAGCAIGDWIGGGAKYWGVGFGGGLGGLLATWLTRTQYKKQVKK